MESSEIPITINRPERKLSEVDTDFINRKIKEDLTAARGIRFGDSIIIRNENDEGSIKDEINIFIKKDSTMVIKSGKTTKEYNFSLPNNDQKKGFNLKEIEGSTRLLDGSMYRKNLYDIIRNDTGVDLDQLVPGLIDLGAKPLGFEAGGSIVWNNEQDRAEVIHDTIKKIYCRNGITYSMGIQKQIPQGIYQLLEIYHLHTGSGESILAASSDDIEAALQLKVPSTIYAENQGNSFLGKEYKIRNNIVHEKAMEEIKQIDSDFTKDQNTTSYQEKCSKFVNDYFDTKLKTLK